MGNKIAKIGLATKGSVISKLIATWYYAVMGSSIMLTYE